MLSLFQIDEHGLDLDGGNDDFEWLDVRLNS